MTKKAWIIVIILCVSILGGLVWMSRSNQIDVSGIDVNTIQEASAMNGNIADHTTGNMDSKVIMFEYGDYQCSGCAAAYPIVKQAVEKYSDKMGFIFRNFPLYSIHPNAFAASSAAEAAGIMGKYWEMHDYLYANNSAWVSLTGQDRTDYFVAAAKSLGLDTNRFTTLLTDPRVKKKIDFDVALGKVLNINATPSMFVDGVNVADQYYADGKIVDEGTDGAQLVWSDADAFNTLVIEPLLKKAGIDVSE